MIMSHLSQRHQSKPLVFNNITDSGASVRFDATREEGHFWLFRSPVELSLASQEGSYVCPLRVQGQQQ